MTFEDFQLFDNAPIDNSIKKRFFKSVPSTRSSNKSLRSKYWNFFGENKNYHQIGNGYLEFDITVRKKDTTNFHDDDPIRLVNNAFAFCFEEARLNTTIGSDFEHNKLCGRFINIYY